MTPKKYYERKAAGLCQACNKPAVPGRVFCKEHAEKRRLLGDKLREEVMAHYGSKCSCCGETELSFLTIDHIDGQGAEHRRENGLLAGQYTYRWLKKNEYPEGFQVLCFNCNCGRQRHNGICPHELSKHS